MSKGISPSKFLQRRVFDMMESTRSVGFLKFIMKIMLKILFDISPMNVIFLSNESLTLLFHPLVIFIEICCFRLHYHLF